MNLITLSQPQSAAAEAYRTLRTNLYFASLEQPFHSLVVTAPTPSEEKSHAVANLAIVMAQIDMRVVLVDADLRNPRLHTIFNTDNQYGLTSALSNPSDNIVLGETPIKNLRLLSAGPRILTPTDAMNSRTMDELIQALKADSDIILFDSPATSVATDAAVLASKTDAALLIVTAGKTKREHAAAAKEQLSRAHARLLGAVMVN